MHDHNKRLRVNAHQTLNILIFCCKQNSTPVVVAKLSLLYSKSTLCIANMICKHYFKHNGEGADFCYSFYMKLIQSVLTDFISMVIHVISLKLIILYSYLNTYHTKQQQLIFPNKMELPKYKFIIHTDIDLVMDFNAN